MYYLKDWILRFHVVAILFSWYYIFFSDGLHKETIFGFMVGAIFSFIIRIFSMKESKIIHQYKEMKILRILDHRDSEEEYRERIKNTEENLWIMGHTAKRLIEDFADQKSPRQEKKILCTKLGDKNFKIRILLPEKNKLSIEKKQDFKKTISRMKEIREKHPENFEVRYFNHKPCYSIFYYDDECLVGPIFENLESKDTPTIHAKKDSKIAKSYLAHFEAEWAKAKKIDDLH